MSRRASVAIAVVIMFLTIAALTSPARAATTTKANLTVKLVINGKAVTPDVPAQLVNDRTMVPARAVFETVGAQVGWVDATRTVTVKYLEHNVSVRIGSGTATVDGKTVTLDVAPLIVADRTLVPLRFIAEAIGAKVDWIQASRTATVDITPAIVGVSWQSGTGYGSLRIDATGPVTATATSLTDPDRVVVDIPGANLALPNDASLDRDQAVTGISTAADETGVHITLSLAGPAGFSLVQDGSQIELRVGYRITAVTPGSAGDDDTVLIETAGPAAYRMTHLSGPNRLVLDFDLSMVDEPLDIQVDGNYISAVRVAQYSADPTVARVVIEFKDEAVPVGVRRTTDGLALTVSPRFTPALAGRTIYIDPGHGGTDPGALGISGTHESDVNLDTALRLQALLSEAGANAILTRAGNYNVELYTRPELANADNADLFVSLHNNWYQSSSGNGTEVYYYLTNPDSPRLAKAVHDALISELGLRDRGVLTANFAVIRVARMPSILVETAFLSNANEDRLLNSADFRQRDAQAVYDGILAYFAAAGAK